MRKWTALFLLLVCLPAAALGDAVKEEIVYVKLSNSGEMLEMYVVNAFESDDDALLTDYGDYTARVNLTNDAALPQTGDSAALALTRGRFYYQGNGLKKPLPWEISIAYSLDGEMMPPEKLSGGNGEIALELSITPRESADHADVIALQATVTLIGEKCLNIRAEGGIIAASGGNRVVTYTILPGMAARYQITCEAENFAMPAIQIAGMRMAMDGDMYAEAFTRDMDEAMRPLAQNMAKAMLSGMAAGDIVSFVDDRNAVQSVQFVMMTEGIFLPNAPEETAEEEAREGFLDRLLHLFGL